MIIYASHKLLYLTPDELYIMTRTSNVMMRVKRSDLC